MKRKLLGGAREVAQRSAEEARGAGGLDADHAREQPKASAHSG
jgi:hypothetical protein